MKSLLQTIQQNLKAALLSTVALLAFLLLGHGQASAQTYQDPATAMNTIKTTLTSLTAAPVKVSAGQPASVSASTGEGVVTPQGAATNARIIFLQQVGQAIKSGLDTAAAIDSVHGTYASSLGNNPDPNALNLLNDTQSYVSALLQQ
jgi:hypothetical protein